MVVEDHNNLFDNPHIASAWLQDKIIGSLFERRRRYQVEVNAFSNRTQEKVIELYGDLFNQGYELETGYIWEGKLVSRDVRQHNIILGPVHQGVHSRNTNPSHLEADNTLDNWLEGLKEKYSNQPELPKA
jgi:hypothetical protein